jgi:septum formation protein
MISNYKIILASKSPRRQELIKELALEYEICAYEVDESFDSNLKAENIVTYLAEKKSLGYPFMLQEKEVLITADTIVWINDRALNKPNTEKEAFDMLTEICGSKHQVYTGVCIRFKEQKFTFFDTSIVHINGLSDIEKWHYIKKYKPFDKAGSYGIQDWFGYTAVEKIEGCFYNVMGLPIRKIYQTLKENNMINLGQ